MIIILSYNIEIIFSVILWPSNAVVLHNNKKAPALRIADIFQDDGSDTGIKMFGDIPVAAG